MNKTFIFLFAVLLVANVCASCDSGQIDINSASASELEELDGIGEVLAGRIIDARPFDDIDDLIDVERIGEKTLEKIKEQGLACVGDGDNDSEEEYEEETEKKETENDITEKVLETEKEVEESKEQEVIVLNAKVVDSGEVESESNGSNFAIYGFVGFCVLLGFLFLLDRRRKREELE